VTLRFPGSPQPDSPLPEPGDDELAHCRAVSARLCDEMSEGSIDFARFMELALYAPGLGYYASGPRKFGPEGDFVTAPELTPVFGGCVARTAGAVLEALGGGDVLEVGAGSGALAADVLTALAARGAAPGRYLILEPSPELRARQGERLAQVAAPLRERVAWIDALPAAGFRGCVLANEVLDAMPVQRFRLSGGSVRLLRVARGEERFVWTLETAPPALADVVAGRTRTLDGAVGYTSEINLRAEAWIATVAGRLGAGAVLVFDYGFPRRELYHPQRGEGTLACHYRHRVHDDPLIYVGLQDITAHVDFTAIADAAAGAGLEVAGYANQAGYLLDAGLAQVMDAQPAADDRARLETAQAVKKLTLPSEMGELFKVMALTRGVDSPLPGFRGRSLLGGL
jgi:SAM-dependent MidA family methyltransferase